MSQLNCRVKVDLSKHHSDVRRFSWIYVDRSNLLFINHVKQHIAEVFDIKEPFHLLLNGKEYLPPNEDVRILKDNELIAVVPGSGIDDSNALSVSTTLPGVQRSIMKHAVQSLFSSKMDYQEENSKININIERKSTEALNNSSAGADAIDTSIDEIMLEVPEIEAASQSPRMDDTIIDNRGTMDPYDVSSHKRRRIRRKRSKNIADTSLTAKINNAPRSVDHKTKILQLTFPPSGKHIHFDNADDKISAIVENSAIKPTAENAKTELTAPILPLFEDSKAGELSTLLALGQYSTPLTFINKKAKHVSENNSEQSTKNDFKVESCKDQENLRTTRNGQHDGINDAADATEEPENFSDLRPEKYPSLENNTHLDDVIAFKVLRIGEEYTPEVSDYVVARTINWCPKKLLYTFKILKGQTQFQSPLGKFSMSEDTTDNQPLNTMDASFSQLIEPRLIYRK